MLWYGEGNGGKPKVFEDNDARASSNPLEVGLCARVCAGSEVGLGLRARSNWWKVSQYSPDILRRVLFFLLSTMDIN